MALTQVRVWPLRTNSTFPPFETYRIKATQYLLREFVSGTITFPQFPLSETLTLQYLLPRIGFCNSSPEQSGDLSVLRKLTSSWKLRATVASFLLETNFVSKRLYGEAHQFSHPCKYVAGSHINSTRAKIMQFNLQVFIVCWAEKDIVLTGPWSEISSRAQQRYSGSSVG